MPNLTLHNHQSHRRPMTCCGSDGCMLPVALHGCRAHVVGAETSLSGGLRGCSPWVCAGGTSTHRDISSPVEDGPPGFMMQACPESDATMRLRAPLPMMGEHLQPPLPLQTLVPHSAHP